MRIIHKKITAATEVAKLTIPAPFSQFYRIVADAEVEDLGWDIDGSPVEEAEGYALKHLSWVLPKEEYEDELADNGLDLVELVQDTDNDDIFLAYVVGDRVYAVEKVHQNFRRPSL